jgi:hypothetical protein
MTKRAWCSSLVVLVAQLTAAPAQAFSSEVSFGLPPDQAGGGGRYFTGSPGDGYTCAVCHAGGDKPHVQVRGLPLDGYRPNTAYEITLDWADTLNDIALTLEVTDGTGIGAGTLHTPPESELSELERCEGTPLGAGIVMPLLNRTVIAMPACKARQLRFLWTAPPMDRGALRFAAAVVSSDAQQNVEGDGVTAISRVLPSPRYSDAKATEIVGCSVPGAARLSTRNAHAPTRVLCGVLLSLVALRWRRQRIARIKPRNASGST